MNFHFRRIQTIFFFFSSHSSFFILSNHLEPYYFSNNFPNGRNNILAKKNAPWYNVIERNVERNDCRMYPVILFPPWLAFSEQIGYGLLQARMLGYRGAPCPHFPRGRRLFRYNSKGREGGGSPRRNRGERKPIVTGSPIKLIGGALAVPFVHCS